MNCPNCKTDFRHNADKPLIVVGVPCLDSVVHQSILAQWSYISHKHRGIFVAIENTYVDMARNAIITDGIKIADHGYKMLPDYFLFIDADTVIAKRGEKGNGRIDPYPQYVDQLIARNVDIVSGYYIKKRDSEAGKPVFGWGHVEDHYLWPQPKDNLLEVDWVGGGYLLVKREVIEKVPAPWFENRNNGMPNGKMQLVGEDIYFCRKVKEHGFKIYVDLNVKLGHHGAVAWPPEA